MSDVEDANSNESTHSIGDKKAVDSAKGSNNDPEMAEDAISDDGEPSAQKPSDSAKPDPEMGEVPQDALEGAA